jgi:hypothetical protein
LILAGNFNTRDEFHIPVFDHLITLLVSKLAAGESSVEFPVNLDLVAFHATVSGAALAPKRLEIRPSGIR